MQPRKRAPVRSNGQISKSNSPSNPPHNLFAPTSAPAQSWPISQPQYYAGGNAFVNDLSQFYHPSGPPVNHTSQRNYMSSAHHYQQANHFVESQAGYGELAQFPNQATPQHPFGEVFWDTRQQFCAPYYNTFNHKVGPEEQLEQYPEEFLAPPIADTSCSPLPVFAPTDYSAPTASQWNNRPAAVSADANCENGVKEPSPSSEEEWDLPYAKLIERALRDAPENKMVLQEIYNWFKERRPAKCNDRSKGWMNSIRHNLSMNHAFVKTELDPESRESKKGCAWVLASEAFQYGVNPTTRFRTKHPKRRANKVANPARQASGARGGRARRTSLKGRRRSARLSVTKGGRSSTCCEKGLSTPTSGEQNVCAPLINEQLCPDGSYFDNLASSAGSPFSHTMDSALLQPPAYGMPGQFQPAHFRHQQYDDFAQLPECGSLVYSGSETGDEGTGPHTPLAYDDYPQGMFNGQGYEYWG